jgi:hypothetical protein
MFVQSVENHLLIYNQHQIHVITEAYLLVQDDYHQTIIEILRIEIIILINIIVEEDHLNINRDNLLYSLFPLI